MEQARADMLVDCFGDTAKPIQDFVLEPVEAIKV